MSRICTSAKQGQSRSLSSNDDLVQVEAHQGGGAVSAQEDSLRQFACEDEDEGEVEEGKSQRHQTWRYLHLVQQGKNSLRLMSSSLYRSKSNRVFKNTLKSLYHGSQGTVLRAVGIRVTVSTPRGGGRLPR